MGETKEMSTNKTTTRHRGLRALAGAAAALMVGAVGVTLTATAAQAAEVDAITGITTTPAEVETGVTIDVTATYKLPDGARAGDTMTINFGDKVEGQPSTFPMVDPAGVKIADCAVAAKATTCTFTDYVNTHGGVTGEVKFPVIGKNVTGGAGLDWTTGSGTKLHTATEVKPRQGGLPSTLYKGHEANADGSIHFYYGIPGDNLIQNGLTVKDVYDARTTLKKETLYAQTRARDANGVITTSRMDPSTYTVTYDDAAHTFTVTFKDGAVNNTREQAYWVEYDMTVGADVPGGTILTNTATAGSLTATLEVTFNGNQGNGNGHPGSISWTKVDEKDKPLGGAEFRLTGPDGTSKTIVDNGEGDADPAAGSFRVEKVAKGTYTLTETKAPAGYDKTERTFTVTVSDETMNPSFGKVVNTPTPPAAVVPPVKTAAPQAHTGGALAEQGDMLLPLAMIAAGVLAVAGAVTVPLVRRARGAQTSTVDTSAAE